MPSLEPVNDAISQAFSCLPSAMGGKAARLLLLAINLQEDPQQLRRQVGGPAVSLFQGEQGGGLCTGVFRHHATSRLAHNLASLRDTKSDPASVYAAIEHDDVLAAGLARLLLWSDPHPLPAVGEVKAAFAVYLETWRPGAYHRGTEAKRDALWKKWQHNYAQALDYLDAQGTAA